MMNQTPTRVSLMWKANLTVVWQFLWLSAVMLSPIVGLEQGQAAEKAAPKTIKLKVLVLNYDPIIGGKRLHVEMNFNDPRALADGYMADIKSATRGLIDFEIVEWRDLNEIYAREDGGIYKVEDYVRMRRANSGWPKSIVADYPRLLNEQGVVPRIDEGSIDEVWVFGDHYFGLWEASMAGPGAFNINGGVYPNVPTARPFAFYGFNYERGVAEMLHNTAHRVEATMNRTYGDWNLAKPANNWELFSANASQSNGTAGVGTCHWPPNAQSDYDYGNRREVMSYADDFLNYPTLTLKKKRVSARTWSPNGLDYHRDYMKWYFARLPKASGVNADGKLNNWLPYIFDFQNYDREGKPKPPQAHVVKCQIKANTMAVTVGLSSPSGIDPGTVPFASAELVVDGKAIASKDLFIPDKKTGTYRAVSYVFPEVTELPRKSLRFRIKGQMIKTLDKTSFADQEWMLVASGSAWEALPATVGRETESATARWIIETGGKVGLKGSPDWIENAAVIPSTKSLPVERIYFWNEGNPKIVPLAWSDVGSFRIYKELDSLELRAHPIGDRSCALLAAMPQLRNLNLHACGITDAGLKQLEPLTNIERLDIGYSQGKITDEGAKSLLKMPKLKFLNIYGSSIGDETLRNVLARLSDLETVEVTSTKVTGEGIAALKRVKPSINVINR